MLDGQNTREEWKDIPKYEGHYQVSDKGRVRSLKRKTRNRSGSWNRKGVLLKLSKGDNYGHLSVRLSKEGKSKFYYVHQLVLLCFVGPCPQGQQCRHLDSNPSNNKLENLRWGTPKEDRQDMIKNGTYPIGENNPAAKLTEDDVKQIRRMYEVDRKSIKYIATIYGRSRGCIQGIVEYTNWKHAC